MDIGALPSEESRMGFALVFENSGVSQRVIRDFFRLGYQGISVGGLPLPHQVDALQEVRTQLTQIRNELAGSATAVDFIVHPAATPWSVRADLHRVCQELGMQLIAPAPKVCTLFGNRLSLLSEAQRGGIPNLLLDDSPLQTVSEVRQCVRRLSASVGYPIVLRSARGFVGGGGIRVLHSEADVDHEVPLWLEILKENTGEPFIFAERYLEGARAISIPYVRFADGQVHFFAEVDYSLQISAQRIIEICPFPDLDHELQTQIRNWTKNFLDQCGYIGVGSLEFLVEENRAYLVDAQCRLNSMFHLWETISHVGAVELQVAAHLNYSAPQTLKKSFDNRSLDDRIGFSAKIKSENTALKIPQPGAIWCAPAIDQWKQDDFYAHWDSPFQSGEEIGYDSDGIVGVLYTVGKEHRSTIQKMGELLSQQFWIGGELETNERFIKEVLEHPWIREGIYHASFLEEEFIPQILPDSNIDLAMTWACQSLSQTSDSSDVWVVGSRKYPNIPRIDIEWIEEPHRSVFESGAALLGRVLFDGESTRVCAFPIRPSWWRVKFGDWTQMVRRVPAKDQKNPSIRNLYSQLGGQVRSLMYQEGRIVPAHHSAVLIRSQKTLVEHKLPIDAKILSWKVQPEEVVKQGQVLAELELQRSTGQKGS